FRRSERSSIWRTKARTRAPRSSSISETCRPVLPWVPPAAEVTRIGFVMATILYFGVHFGTLRYRIKMWYRMVPSQVRKSGDESKVEGARGGNRRDRRPEADRRRGPFGVHGGRLRADQHAGDRDAR